jgi:hypothetical protein
MNPELESKIQNILALVEEIKSMEQGEESLLKALNYDDSKKEEDMANKAKEVEPKEEVVDKDLIKTPSKGPTVNDAPASSFANLPQEDTEGMKMIAKSVSELVTVVRSVKRENDSLRKAMNNLLLGMGVSKSIEAAAKEQELNTQVHKSLKNGDGKPFTGDAIEQIRKSLEAQGFVITKKEEKPSLVAPHLVKKNQTSPDVLKAMVLGL